MLNEINDRNVFETIGKLSQYMTNANILLVLNTADFLVRLVNNELDCIKEFDGEEYIIPNGKQVIIPYEGFLSYMQDKPNIYPYSETFVISAPVSKIDILYIFKLHDNRVYSVIINHIDNCVSFTITLLKGSIFSDLMNLNWFIVNSFDKEINPLVEDNTEYLLEHYDVIIGFNKKEHILKEGYYALLHDSNVTYSNLNQFQNKQDSYAKR